MITTYTGENDGARLAAVKQAVESFVATYTDMGLERFDGEEANYEQLLAAVQSLPFLVERKLVVIRSASQNKDFVERFEDFLVAITDSTDVLLVEGKLDKRTVFYKTLQKQTEFRDFPVLDTRGLIQYARDYAKDHGGSLGEVPARHLVERTVLSQIGLQHELDKLLAYAPTITNETIDMLTEEKPQSRIFDLLDAAFAGNSVRTLALYADQRAQGTEPEQIVALLAWQLYIFAVCKAGHRKTPDEIARAARLNPFVVSKSLAVVRRMAMGTLKKYIQDLTLLDARSKSEGIILDEALQHYLLTLTVG